METLPPSESTPTPDPGQNPSENTTNETGKYLDLYLSPIFYFWSSLLLSYLYLILNPEINKGGDLTQSSSGPEGAQDSTDQTQVQSGVYFDDKKVDFDFFDDDEAPVRPLTKRGEFLDILCDAPEKMIIVVYYYADLAGRCKSMKNFFYGVAELYRGKALFYDINLDKADASFKKGVHTLPSIKFYKGSFQIDAIHTYDEALIQFRLETYLDGKKPNGSYIV